MVPWLHCQQLHNVGQGLFHFSLPLQDVTEPGGPLAVVYVYCHYVPLCAVTVECMSIHAYSATREVCQVHPVNMVLAYHCMSYWLAPA